MLNLDKNYLNTVKLADTTTLIIIDGAYCQELSDSCDYLSYHNHTININSNAAIQKPIHMLYINSQPHEKTVNIAIHTSTKVSLIEEHINQNPKAKIATKTNIVAASNSELTYYKLQKTTSTNAYHSRTNFIQKNGSKVKNCFLGTGSQMAHETITVDLSEKNSSYEARGIIALKRTNNLTYDLRIEHSAPNCNSNVLFKGLINDQAQGSFKCLVTAHPNATQTTTHVTNKNLLLSNTAVMDTTPQLVINTDDVVCTHGATVGQLDAEALFYLCSRGIDETSAKKMLIAAFVSEITDTFAKYSANKIDLDLNYEL